MHRLRRILFFAIPTGWLAALGIALPAHAAALSVVVSCVGGAGSATTSPAVPLVSGTGSYTFGNAIVGGDEIDFTCELVTPAGKRDEEVLAITSTGTYNNFVCGTGTAEGTNTGITAVSFHLPGSTDLTGMWTGKDLSYQIDFVGGQGVLQFEDPSNPLHPGSSNATGGGQVTLVPSNPMFDGVHCTNGFKVVGNLAFVM